MASFGPLVYCFFRRFIYLFFGSELLKKDTATTTQKRITDIFCWLTFSFVAWKFHESIRVIFHGLSLVNMLLLSDASRVPEKTTSNQPPLNSPRNGREKLHIPQFLGAFLGSVVGAQDVENQEYHPPISCTLGHLIASLNIYLPQLLCPATVQGS